MNKDMNIVNMKIKEIIPYEKNAKKHDKTQIANVAESIKRFGFVQPLVIDKDNVLIIGHCRLLAAKQLKLREVPVVRMDDLTEEQVKQLRLLDNKLNESDWDFDLLADEIGDLDFDGFDIDWGISELEEEETEIIQDEVPDNVERVCNTGDIWQLGDHKLICGDSTDRKTFEKLFGKEKATMTFTSPPYNVGDSSVLNGNTHMKESKYLGSDDNLTDYDRLLNMSTENAMNFSKYAFINLQMLANNKITLCEYMDRYKKNLCDIAIWVKTATAPAMARKVMNSQFEFIYIFSKENNSRAIGNNDFRGTVSNVYQGNPQRNNEYANIHGASFPIEFPAHFIQNFTNEGDSVLDTFGGTGTTMIACEQLGRKCFMSELDPHYCDVIIARWEKFTGKKAVKINATEEGR